MHAVEGLGIGLATGACGGCATTRRPASSNLAMILPVRFRRVASGLMIERVRSTAMGISE